MSNNLSILTTDSSGSESNNSSQADPLIPAWQESPESSSASSGLGLLSSVADGSNKPSSATVTPYVKAENIETFKSKDIDRVLFGATLCDVVVTLAFVNPSDKSKSLDKMTRLQSIMGVQIYRITLDLLRRFASKYRSVPHQNKRKKAVCEFIVKLVIEFQEDKIQLDDEGALIVSPVDVDDVGHQKIHHMNRKRYINVMFSDAIVPLLLRRGESLTKEHLQEGIKTDQPLHEAIIKQYNTEGLHDDDAWPSVGLKGSAELKLKPIHWKQSQKTLANLIREYEKCFVNFKKSGNHGDFGEAEQGSPFADFVQNNQSLLYLHQFVYKYPHVLDKITGSLPSQVFSESIQSKDTKRAAKKRKRDSANDGIAESFGAMQQTLARKASSYIERTNAITMRANSLVFDTLISTMTKLDDSISRGQEKKRDLWGQGEKLSTSSRTKKLLKGKFKDYKVHREDPTYDSDDSDEEFQDSQRSLFEQIYDEDRKIKQYKEIKKRTEEEMEASKKNMGKAIVVENVRKQLSVIEMNDDRE